jgi:hypothetical protein
VARGVPAIEVGDAEKVLLLLALGDSCILDVQATATCYFEVKGKVKASANVWDGSRIITSLPASR